MQVFVRDNNVDQALRALKKKMQREGVFREMKLRKHYEKRSERRIRRRRKPSAAPASSPVKSSTRGFAADEASGNPRRWKSRPAARASLLILEQPDILARNILA